MKYLSVLICFVLLSCTSKEDQERPNIILIIADDLGYGDLGFLLLSPEDVHTPNLDQMAAQGTYFSNAYATSPICSPSRTGLVTGRYQARWGNYWYGEGGLPASELTIPQMLGNAGYHTYKIGKTHMNGGPVHHPLDHGFQEFLGFIDHTWDYLRLSKQDVAEYGEGNARKAHLGPLMQNREKISFENDYTTDIFTRKAIEVIQSESEQPFYIHLSYNAVHHPTYICHPDYLDEYGIEQFPFWNPQKEPYQEWHSKWGGLGEVDPDGRKRYLLQLQVMDEGIGRIVEALKATGQFKNTVIIFISDNGGTINTYANNRPLNGYKYMFGEGGIRVPMLISWPGQLTRKKTEDALVSAMDIFPTLADITNQSIPENLDGVSLIPLLKGQADRVHETLFFSNGRDSWVVRHGPWKLAHNIEWDHSSFKIVDGRCIRDSAYHYPGGTRLYNLDDEIAEQNDLSERYPGVVDSLQLFYAEWRKEMVDPMKPDAPPNIIIILADDAGYADFGFMGSDMATPNIDRLARSGVVFTDAHITATVCSPSRAGLITGRYQQRFGHEANIPPSDLGMDPDEKTIGDALKLAGYTTGIIGKWHLGTAEQFHPNNRGFDEFWGFLGGSRSYFFNDNKEDREGQDKEILHNQTHVNFNGYLTDEFSYQSVKFIEENKDNLFFLFLSYNAVHTPMHAKEADLDKFKDHPRAKLAAMTWATDRGVGMVLDKLEKESLAENTLIFFLSDNGGASNNYSSNLPLKGFKGNKFEGGHRTPFILSWPVRVTGGQQYDGLTSSLDIFATSIAAAGLENSPGKPLDGVNLIPHITGIGPTEPHRNLYWRKEKMAAVRDGDYKLIRLDDYGYRLYNLKDDLGETNDLSESQPGFLNELKASLESWETELITPMWAESDPWQRVTFEIHKALMENRDVTIKSPADLIKLDN